MAQERQSCTGPHLGTWKLQSFTTEDLATGRKTDLFGAHPSGYLSYGPDGRMYAILVKEGQAVTKGQLIAEMGDSDADSVRLHFEVRQQGKPVDPAKFLPAVK